MSDKTNNQKFHFRAKIPLILRVFVLGTLVFTIIFIVIGFYRNSQVDEFRLKPGDTRLSKDVVGEVNGYERREIESGTLKYYIKADKAITFSDEHQELENVYLQVFDEDNQEISDKITSDKAIYIPAKDQTKNFRIYFAGDVSISTRYDLNIKTEQLAYDKSTDIADSEANIEFTRENVFGSASGAVVNIGQKTLDLLNKVEVNIFASEDKNVISDTNLKTVRLKSNRAKIDQIAEKITLQDSVEIYLTPQNQNSGNIKQPTDIKADQATAFFNNKEINKIDLNGNVSVIQKPTKSNPGWTKATSQNATVFVNKELKKVVLEDNVQIETTANNSNPTRIRSAKATYQKDLSRFDLERKVEIITVRDSNQTKITAESAVYEQNLDRFELTNDVQILTNQDSKPTRISASNAIYEQITGKILLSGNAEIKQLNDYIKGNVINAELYDSKQLKYATATGNAFLRQQNSLRKTEVKAEELNANFSKTQTIQKANALGNADVLIIPAKSEEYSRFGLFAPKAINLEFRNDGTLNNLVTQGRTTLKLNSASNRTDAANKTVTADKVTTFFRNTGNELARATAIGDAELVIDPLNKNPQNYKTIVNADRFDCEFFTNNNARSCLAVNQTKVIRYPKSGKKGNQNLTANRLNVTFNPENQDVEMFEASGKAKFSEDDRQAIADQITYNESNKIVRLTGGNPTIWDLQARANAEEILWDTEADRSKLIGEVSTTYYSQKNTGGATPFGNVNSPVFITARQAEFDHRQETGFYSGNARAWQDNNYIRSEKLLIKQKSGELFAEGKVQSLLYDSTRTISGRKSKIPIYASSDKMIYLRKNNLLRYENNVDIRQGNDRIQAQIANVFLDKKNQLTKTIVEKNVIITQPNRKATGTYAQYNAADESVILRGNPAEVRDADSGSTSGREMVVYLKDKRVINNGNSTPNNTGRIRTVYKIKKDKLN